MVGDAQEELVKLNQKCLKITSVRVDQKKADFDYNDKEEVVNIKAGKVGEMKIEVDFEGKLTDSMMGIYPSYYEVDGEKKQLVGTQFETTFARQAFPCVDRQKLKLLLHLQLSLMRSLAKRLFPINQKRSLKMVFTTLSQLYVCLATWLLLSLAICKRN